MKNLLLWLSIGLLCLAALSTPVAIGVGIYDWAIDNQESKLSLWNAFLLWIKMLATGVVVGFPLYLIANSMK